MKKICLVSILLFMGIFSLSAQSRITKDEMQINAGFGFSNTGLPVYAGLDYAIHQDITIGGQLIYKHYKDKFKFEEISYKYNLNMFGLLINANYHFNTLIHIPDPWDVYAGINIGYVTVSSSGDYHGNISSSTGLSFQIGARYFFSEQWGVNLELMGGNDVVGSGGRIGITYKL